MVRILLEWFHLDVEGQTCQRCSDTGIELQTIVRKLNMECRGKGVTVVLKETLLAANEVERSNSITINGELLENVLSNAHVSSSDCDSCGELIGAPAECRTVVHFGQVYETVPQQLIREAVCQKAHCC